MILKKNLEKYKEFKILKKLKKKIFKNFFLNLKKKTKKT